MSLLPSPRKHAHALRHIRTVLMEIGSTRENHCSAGNAKNDLHTSTELVPFTTLRNAIFVNLSYKKKKKRTLIRWLDPKRVAGSVTF